MPYGRTGRQSTANVNSRPYGAVPCETFVAVFVIIARVAINLRASLLRGDFQSMVLMLVRPFEHNCRNPYLLPNVVGAALVLLALPLVLIFIKGTQHSGSDVPA